MKDIDWKVLALVAVRTTAWTIGVVAGILLFFGILLYLGIWSFALVPLGILYLFISVEYQAEMRKRGKRLH